MWCRGSGHEDMLGRVSWKLRGGRGDGEDEGGVGKEKARKN